MTDEDARYYVNSMTKLQREILLLCSQGQSWGYSRLAEKVGVSYADAKSVGDYLLAANLASIEYIRHGREFAGSSIFLNERGEQVRAMASRKRKLKN